MTHTSADLHATSYLYGTNSTYIADLYERYTQNPDSVDAEWGHVFHMLDGQSPDALDDLKGATDSRVVAGGELSPQQQLILDLLRSATNLSNGATNGAVPVSLTAAAPPPTYYALSYIEISRLFSKRSFLYEHKFVI